MDGLRGLIEGGPDQPLYVFSPRHGDWIPLNPKPLEWFVENHRPSIPEISAETVARWDRGERVVHRRPGLCVVDDIQHGRRAKVFCCHEIWWDEGADDCCMECTEGRCGWSDR